MSTSKRIDPIKILLLLFFFNLKSETILIFGGKTGWIGQKIALLLKKEGHIVYCAKSKLENREDVKGEIQDINPNYIINTAGIIGKPNVDWCESHKQETMRVNVLGIANLVDLAYINNIHITNIATGCIYQYNESHPINSGIGFTEDEEPNFTGSFYSKTKILAEKIILTYPNVLNLRLRMPIASDLHSHGFIGKIIKYKKLIDVPNSMSILDDLLPLIPQMLKRNLLGNYNFVNPGTISHNQVIELYKKYINSNHQYENFSIEEQNKILKSERSNCELSPFKLLQEFPNIPHIQDSIVKIFNKIREEK